MSLQTEEQSDYGPHENSEILSRLHDLITLAREDPQPPKKMKMTQETASKKAAPHPEPERDTEAGWDYIDAVESTEFPTLNDLLASFTNVAGQVISLSSVLIGLDAEIESVLGAHASRVRKARREGREEPLPHIELQRKQARVEGIRKMLLATQKVRSALKGFHDAAADIASWRSEYTSDEWQAHKERSKVKAKAKSKAKADEAEAAV